MKKADITAYIWLAVVAAMFGIGYCNIDNYILQIIYMVLFIAFGQKLSLHLKKYDELKEEIASLKRTSQ